MGRRENPDFVSGKCNSISSRRMFCQRNLNNSEIRAPVKMVARMAAAV
jgi:hypothetical protein